MKTKIYSCLFIFLFFNIFSFVPLQAGGGDYPPLSAEELNSYYQALQNEIDLAEKRVQDLLERIKRKEEILTGVLRSELETAITMLKTKKILVSNFIDTPSLNSPLIRKLLLEILQKELIVETDLIELQRLVEQEKEL